MVSAFVLFDCGATPGVFAPKAGNDGERACYQNE